MRLLRLSIYTSLLLMFLLFNGCKKEATSTVGFSTAQLSMDELTHTTASVNINLAATNFNNPIDVWFQSVGKDPLNLGSINARFLSEDSDRLIASLTGLVNIDTTAGIGHIQIPLGSTGFTINLNTLFNNFKKRAKEYQLKIVKVTNANVTSGKDVLTIDLPDESMIPVFSDTLKLVDASVLGLSAFSLTSSQFTQVSGNTYNVQLSYTVSAGSGNPSPVTGIDILYTNFVPLDSVQRYQGCSVTNASITIHGGTGLTYTCSSGINYDTLMTNFAVNHNVVQPSYGPYQQMGYNALPGALPIPGYQSWSAGPYSARSFLYCPFVVF